MEENKMNYYRKFLDDNSKEDFITWFVEVMQKHGISKEKIINFLGKQLGPWIKQCLSWGLCYNMAVRVLKPIRYTEKQ